MTGAEILITALGAMALAGRAWRAIRERTIAFAERQMEALGWR